MTVRVQKPQGLLATNPMNDDLCIGTSHGKLPFIPAHQRTRCDRENDESGRATEPTGEYSISSAAFALADDTGNALGPGAMQIPVPSGSVVTAASASATAQPVVTVQVTGGK